MDNQLSLVTCQFIISFNSSAVEADGDGFSYPYEDPSMKGIGLLALGLSMFGSGRLKVRE